MSVYSKVVICRVQMFRNILTEKLKAARHGSVAHTVNLAHKLWLHTYSLKDLFRHTKYRIDRFNLFFSQ